MSTKHKIPNQHLGSNIEDFLKEEGIFGGFEEVQPKRSKRWWPGNWMTL